MSRLEQIRARLAAATSGPWEVAVNGNTVKSHAVKGVCSGISPKTGNAAFIAHAPEDIAALLAVADALQELLVVAAMRGDDKLPNPADDPLPWTARMQTAWIDGRAALDALEVE